ncbi:MAG: translesion DNA synthesis-associated protein ImuA [Granulosicoccus sp.]
MNPAALDTLLKAQPALWRGRDRYTVDEAIPTGFAALDKALPAKGWSIGGVTELLLERQGIGELSLLLPALRHVAGRNSSTSSNNKAWAALINPPHIPYAPAFSNAGIALDRLLIVDSGDDINTLWATEQILRSGLFGAVVAWVQKSSAQRQRRLQLAAETGRCWATVYRPLHAHKEHSPVSTRICVSMSQQRTAQLTLDIIKVRAGSPQIVTIQPDEFDASQGAEWPVPGKQPVLRGINEAACSANSTPAPLRSLSGIATDN